METLKKSLTAVFLCGLLSISAYTQDKDKALQQAFADSYTQEYAGEYNKAVDALKKVYSEKSYEINLRLGWLMYMSGLFTESLAYYQKASNLMPYSIEAKLGYVYPAAALGNWEQVIKQYNDILKIDTKNATANYRLGLIYYGREDYSTAYKYFEQVINLYPFDYYYTLYFAWTNLRLGKNKEAKVLFNKVLVIQPNDESALEGLGLIK
ncbi:MAG: tetratricopeptide repeat protein [Bacteroidales bacterium]